MTDMLPMIAGMKLYEIVFAVSCVCLSLILLNANRLNNVVCVFVGFISLSYFLWGGLARFEDLGEPGNLFLYWGIGGAIAAFTLRGSVALGCAGGIFGVVMMLVLGFILCPLYWLLYVFIILSTCFRVAPKYNLVVALISVLSVTTILWKQEIIVHEHRHYGDGKTCCGVYVRGEKFVDGKWVEATGSRQALVTGESYTASSLEPSCGSFAPWSERHTRLFRLTSGMSADSVNIETYTGNNLVAVAPSTLAPGCQISIIPAGASALANDRVNSETLENYKSNLRSQTRRLKVESLLYAYPDGSVRGHTNYLRKWMN